jgi:4-amino-4-deoxy-L-arabinose transferase-like glycosyltransferase
MRKSRSKSNRSVSDVPPVQGRHGRRASRRPGVTLAGPHARYGPAALAALFVFALVWRIAYIVRIEDAALMASLRADESVYWDWATYLMSHDFQGSNPFFFGPLYPYALAIVRSVTGSDPFRVLVVQAIWGSAAAVLIADALRRLVGWPIAIAAGVLYTLYEMNVFFDGLILMESLVLFLEALLIWLWTRTAQTNGGFWSCLSIGAVTGLVALGRATGALLLLPVWWIVSHREGESWRPVVKRLAVVFVSFIATIAPAAIHNWNVSKEFIPFTYNFGINLYIGNHEYATGRYIWVAGAQGVDAVQGLRPDGGIESDGRKYLQYTEGLILSPRESSEIWADRSIRWAQSHPLDVLKLAGAKILLLWNMREQHQIESAKMYRNRAGPLGLPWVGSFLFVAVLGMVGLWQAGSHRVGQALRAYVAVFTLSMLPFFVTDRYRAHLVPALVMLSAIAVYAWLRRPRRPGTLARFGLPAVLAFGLAIVPISSPSGRLHDMLESLDMGTRWLDQGRPDRALVEYEKAVALDATIPDIAELLEPDARGALFFNYAYALRATGRSDAWMKWFERATEVAPENPKFLRTLGDAYLAAGRLREGDSLLAKVELLMGADSELLMSRGYDAARDGNLARAESLFVAAVDQSMRHFGAWGALIRVQVQQQALSRAQTSVNRFKQTGAPPHVVRLYEGFVLAASGHAAQARAALEEVPLVMTQDEPTLGWVRSTTEKMIAAAEGR